MDNHTDKPDNAGKKPEPMTGARAGGNLVRAPYVVMVKPAGAACNLACSYCYYAPAEQYYRPKTRTSSPPRMSYETLDVFTRKYIQSSPGPVVQFTWHGGEPALAGLDFFREAVRLQKKYLPPSMSVWNNLQTNGTLITREWCQFLQDNAFDAGISIDGARTVHDAARLDFSGYGTFDKTVSAIRLMQRFGIQPDLLCTVTKRTAQDASGVYKQLRNLKTGWIQFIPVVRFDETGHVTDDSTTSEGYSHVLKTAFLEWAGYDVDKVHVQQFAEMILILTGQKSNLCQMSETCGRVVVVEHDGAVYSCDHFVDPLHRLGNVHEDDMAAMVDSKKQTAFGLGKSDDLSENCRSCRWLTFCWGACPKDRISASGQNTASVSWLCEGLKSFFAYACEPLKEYVAAKKEGLSGAAVSARMIGALSSRFFKGISPADSCPCESGKKAGACCWAYKPSPGLVNSFKGR